MYILDLFFKGPFWKPLPRDWRPPLKILIIYVIFLFIFYWSQHVMWLNMPKLVILNLENIWVIFSNIQNCDVENTWRIINSIASIRCERMLQSYLSLDVICSIKERRVWKNCELWRTDYVDAQVSQHVLNGVCLFITIIHTLFIFCTLNKSSDNGC